METNKEMSEEFIKVVNFNGVIYHVINSGENSDLIIYVSNVTSDDSVVSRESEKGASPNSVDFEKFAIDSY
ncbi:unnamed protein product, partial [Thelazia callipaeda]|uniref:Conserved domain protein n=1 Tax=Thelazia callipaeda TaxID=103827 RepID=A0A0N5D968_THECL